MTETHSTKEKPVSKRRKKSLFDWTIEIICFGILTYFVINEFSHLYRTPLSFQSADTPYSRHYNLSTTFPFVGSYFLMVPQDYNTRYKYPLVVALHGISDRVYASEFLAEEKFRSRFKAFILVPIAPKRAFWETPENEAFSLPQFIPYPDHMPSVMRMITSLQGDYNIDEHKIYLTGHSMGGQGVYGALQNYPDTFAAAQALSGTWDPQETYNILTPLWIIHGSNDRQIPPKYSREVAATLKQRGADAQYSELQNTGHDSWRTIYSKQSSWDWLFAHTKQH